LLIIFSGNFSGNIFWQFYCGLYIFSFAARANPVEFPLAFTAKAHKMQAAKGVILTEPSLPSK
jgi:hypothetical protein